MMVDKGKLMKKGEDTEDYGETMVKDGKKMMKDGEKIMEKSSH